MMKKFFLIAFIATNLLVTAQTNDPIVMTVGDEKVTLSEFEYIFKKNNNATTITKQSLDEYMDLFVKFKLKVKEAKDMKMDTAYAFRQELSGYVDQLAQPYLKDKLAEERVIREIYDRSQWDLKIKHIVVKLPDCPTAKDTLEAYNKILGYRKEILKKKNFEEIAQKYSSDSVSAKKGGLIGYFTGMMLNYQFETEAYRLKIGEVSNIVRTTQGYHLIKVEDKRPARGKVKVGHIFIRADEKDTAMRKAAMIRIDEIYSKLQAGGKWEELCKNFSEDTKNSANGGELPAFGINQMVQNFEDAAFNLNNPGDYSKPVPSAYGFHIIRLIEKPKLGTFEEAKTEIGKVLAKSRRFEIVQTDFVNQLKKQFSFVENQDFMKKLEAAAEANGMRVDKAMLDKLNNMKLFSYKGGEINSDEFIKISTEKMGDKGTGYCSYKKKNYEDYIKLVLMDYKKSQLPNENKDFKLLVNEYKEGIMLFNIMDAKVWTKSVKDTVGLKAYHDANKTKYMWGERAETMIIDCKNDTVEKAARKLAKKLYEGKITKEKFLSTLNKKSKDNVFILDGLYSKEDNNSFVTSLNFQKGISATEKKDGKTRFAIVKNIRGAEAKTLKESKGVAISDYQTFLEEEWLKSLRAKYNVSIDKNVLYQLAK